MSIPTPEFRVLLHSPDLPPPGIKARAHFEEGVLVVQGKGHWYTVPLGHISLKVGGFDGRQWMIVWTTPHGQASAMLQGDEAVEAFIDLAPPDISGELRRAHAHHSRTGMNFRIALALAALVLLLPVLALGLFWVNGDRISQWAADQVSLEQKKKLGELAYAQMLPGLKVIDQGPVHDSVEQIGVRLTAGTTFRFTITVADDPRVNAFALPGGYVVVFTGLLRAADSADEVAGVLAHEASHVLQGHALRNMIHALGWRAVLALAMGDMSGGIWGDMAQELVGLGYSRDLEREADLEGLKLLRRAGIPADGMARFFAKMAQQQGEGIEFLSSHPANSERLDALRAAIQQEGPYVSQALDIDWNQIRRALPAPVK